MTDDGKVGIGKGAVALGGAGAAQAAEMLHHFTLADMASAVVIAYTVYQFYCLFYDRNIKPRGGWAKFLGFKK